MGTSIGRLLGTFSGRPLDVILPSEQFPSSSLDSLIKILSNDDFKYSSQEFDNNVLDLVKQKGLYPYEYMSDFGKFKEQLRRKEKFYSSVTGK